MKKLWVAGLIFILPFTIQAQLGSFVNRAKSKVQARINNKADEAVDKTLDVLIDGKPAEPAKATKPVSAPPANTAAKAAGPTASEPKEEEVEKPAMRSYSKFDFVPGEKIIYTEDFAQDAIGELPTNWNASGKGEVMTIDGRQGKWLRLYENTTYLSGNKKDFGENYTIEFDMIYYFQPKKTGYLLPDATFGFFASGATDNGDNKFLKDYEVINSIATIIHPYGSGTARIESSKARLSTFNSDQVSLNDYMKDFNKPLHYSIQVQKQRLRLWINETKVFDVPRAVNTGDMMNQLFFHLENSNYQDDEVGLYLQSIKVATGLPDTRHKLIDEGKFSTTGILFDFQSAVIRQESYGVIKEIATVLKENPSVKVKVIGHTSNDGDAAANMELSKQRAAAVKNLIVKEYGIDAANITTDGKGPTQPVADNKTKEGKAQNRRVEFVKM
jgi:outer membrane protein OmpA-like peptidoglycan-associated protein